MAFSNPIVAGTKLIIAGIQSTDYELGQSGWSIEKNGNAQFNNLQITGDVGVTNLVAEDLLINGESFLLDYAPSFTSCLGYYDRSTSSGTMNQTQERSIISAQFDAKAGYTYQFISSGLRLRSTTAAQVTDGAARIRYTTDGSTPSLTSTILAQSVACNLNTIGTSVGINRIYIPSADCTVKFLLTVASVQSDNDVFENFVSVDFPCQVWVNQLGPTDIFGTDSSLFSGGGGSAGTPVTTYTKTYTATFGGGYRANNAPTTASDSFIWQGYGDSFNGNQKGLVGFPYTTIQSDLTGATVQACSFRFKVGHTWFNSGSQARLGTHTYTSEPGTYNPANVSAGLVTSGTAKQGGTYNVPLGTTIGNAFKNGTARGIALGPWTSNANVGYMNIYNSSSLLQLIITYRK